MAGLVELPPMPSTSSNQMSSGEERQIAIRLTTKDSAYSIPSTKFLVPSSWRRFHLSELINKVLEIASPIPFDFLIDSTLLRSSLGAFCAASGVSEEVTLDVEYLPSTLPPQLASSIPSDDWISDVSLAVKGSILTASYGGTLTLNTSLVPVPANVSFHGHDASVLSCCFVPHPSGSTSQQWVASAGMDRSARVWQYQTTLPSTPIDDVPTPKALYSLVLHTAPVASVRSRPLPTDPASVTNSPHVLTAGWDGSIGVWDLTAGVNEGEQHKGDGIDGSERRKKRKKQTPGTIINKSPVSVLLGHSGKISRAIFDRTEAQVAYSAGWDHTVRSWDLTVAAESGIKRSDKVLLDLTQMASRNLLATGSTDRTVCFWDVREDSQNISLVLPGHSGPVSSVSSHPTSPLLLASGSYDSTVRLWDARSPKQALFILNLPSPTTGENTVVQASANGQKEKILSVDWDGERLAAGGEGKRVVVWNVNESSATVTAADVVVSS